MPSLVIFGASGFVGRALIAQQQLPMAVKAVSRSASTASMLLPGVLWQVADLMDEGSIDAVLEPDDVVINLVYMPRASEDDNLRSIDHLIAACRRKGVARLVHCSTANVVGATTVSLIDERTLCVPATSYEQAKWLVEQRVIAAADAMDVVVARPTAIVGPGGQNLLALARSMTHDSRATMYVRACLFGDRPMHLVPVHDVTAALLHLANLPGSMRGEVFVISSDDDPGNRFSAVESVLLEALGLPRRTIPPLPIPTSALSLALRVRRRSETNVDRMYSPAKLRATGFRPVEPVDVAVRDFGRSVQSSL